MLTHVFFLLRCLPHAIFQSTFYSPYSELVRLLEVGLQTMKARPNKMHG